MIDASAFKEIIDLYEKHGWKLRRVLLSAKLKERLNVAGFLQDTEVRDSDLDAAWFTRSTRPDQTAWEIRHLNESPFALVEVIPNNASTEEIEETLSAAEAKMMNITSKRPRAN